MAVIRDMSSKDYHSKPNTFSSSQLKTILEDPELFYRKYITKELAKEENAAFDIGTYFHTAILEPHILEEECALFQGKRIGKAWEAFKVENAHKTIITTSEYNQAKSLIDAVRNSDVAMGYLSQGEAEVSAFVDLIVYQGQVFSSGKVLSPYGWVPSGMPKEGTLLTIKCRADFLGDEYILDLKSTSGNCKDERTIKQKISQYSYDLSAALYLDIFSIALNKNMERFYWTFASKDLGNSKTFLASSKNIRVGRAKWKKAIVTLANFIENDWVFKDELGILDPNFWEEEWLQTKAEDSL